MSRARRYREDLSYAEWHRLSFPEMYQRIQHRLVQADRDWTEFCHYCSQPLAIFEEVRDVGQDLLDKATTVTRKLAVEAGLPARLIAWRTERPAEAQSEIDELGRRISELERQWPIVGFKTRLIAPQQERKIDELHPEEWCHWIAILHREHHHVCKSPRASEFPVAFSRLLKAIHEHPLHDGRLWRAA